MRWHVRGTHTATGAQRAGIVNANTQQEAVQIAYAQGLTVTEIKAADQAPAPPVAAPPAAAYAPPSPAYAPPAQAYPGDPDSGASPEPAPPAISSARKRFPKVSKEKLPLILSMVALALSITAVVWVWLRGPGVPGKGISSYDFSTPEGAVRSTKEIEAHRDLRAAFELIARSNREERERAIKALDTFKFEKDYDGGDGKKVALYKITTEDANGASHTEFGVAYLKMSKDGVYEVTTQTDFKLSSEATKAVDEWRAKGTSTTLHPINP